MCGAILDRLGPQKYHNRSMVERGAAVLPPNK